ncbi:MAG: hypothetical protein ACRDR6_25265, partial [Pseudonocardiaceae bacterium]
LMISDGYRWPLYSDDDTTPIKRSLPEDLPEAHPTTPSNLTVPHSEMASRFTAWNKVVDLPTAA